MGVPLPPLPTPEETIEKLGGFPSATPNAPPPPSRTQAALQAIAQLAGNVGQNQGGLLSPAMVPQPPKVSFDPRGPITLPQPLPQPIMPVQGPSQSELLAQSRMSPEGSAAASAVSGLAQAIMSFKQKKDMKEQAEAANYATAIMNAYGTGHPEVAQAVMDNPRAEKLLNKWFKGWLVPEQKKPKKQDNAMVGLQQAVAAQQQQTLRGASGRTYLFPGASPQQMLQNALTSANIQAAQQDPSRLLGMSDWQKIQLQIGLSAAQNYAHVLGEAMRADATLRAAEERLEALRRIHEQDDKTKKDIADIMTKSAELRARILSAARVHAAEIFNEARKTGKAPADLEIRHMESLVGLLTKEKGILAGILKSSAVQNDDTLKQSIQAEYDRLTTQLDNFNGQLEDLQSRQDFLKQWQELGFGDIGEENEP
jgi:hypothetical protein